MSQSSTNTEFNEFLARPIFFLATAADALAHLLVAGDNDVNQTYHQLHLVLSLSATHLSVSRGTDSQSQEISAAQYLTPGFSIETVIPLIDTNFCPFEERAKVGADSQPAAA